jgi:hypothetical protein
LFTNPFATADFDDEWNGFSDRTSGSSTATEIPNPLISGESSPDITSLQARVNAFGKSHGFGVVRRNASGRKEKRQYTLECDKYSNLRAPEDAGIRKRKSRKCGCKWKLIAEALASNKFFWTLREFADSEYSRHNHKSSTTRSAHSVHRRLTSPIKSTIATISQRVGIRARDIGVMVQKQFRESILISRNIYNAQAAVTREKLGNYNSTAAFIKLFDEREIPYIVK